VPVELLGSTGGETLEIADVGTLDLPQLRTAWEGTLPALFDSVSAVVEATEAAR
jgi:hypothetical protein